MTREPHGKRETMSEKLERLKSAIVPRRLTKRHAMKRQHVARFMPLAAHCIEMFTVKGLFMP
jgi:hypothetical protein